MRTGICTTINVTELNTSSDYQYMYLHVIKHFAVNEGVL